MSVKVSKNAVKPHDSTRWNDLGLGRVNHSYHSTDHSYDYDADEDSEASSSLKGYKRPARVLGLPARPQRGKLTRCYRPVPRSVSLNRERIIRTLTISAIVAVFCLSHLYLRFVIADVKLEFKELQQRKAILERQATRMERDNIQLSDFSRLEDKAAQQFGLVEDPNSLRNLAVIPHQIYERYSTEIDSSQSDSGERMQFGVDAEKRTALANIFNSLVDGNWAFANTGK
jgi:hypothetical protein